jgi:PBP1b-binding outer membrane lipoprotein LpoB
MGEDFKAQRRCIMNIIICLLLIIFLQGCNQNKDPSTKDSMKEDAFKNYVNSNTQQETNESKPIVNVAF